jgi:1,4-dihydroxy-2-naphthoate octaprenyltransferase
MLRLFLQAIRLKTLAASLSPAILGSALAYHHGTFLPWVFVWGCGTIVCLQMGTNLANDYYDAKRGGDRNRQHGTTRLTAAGLVSPSTMCTWMVVTFLAGLMCSVPLIYTGGWVLMGIVVLGAAIGYLYTGGPYPLAYHGLGDLAVFSLLGPLATGSAYYLHTHTVHADALILSLIPGCLATAILLINNMRDCVSDQHNHKYTLVVRFGLPMGRVFYWMMLGIALCVPAILAARYPIAIAYVATPLLIRPLQIIHTPPRPAFNSALAQTALFLLVFSGLIATQLVLAA